MVSASDYESAAIASAASPGPPTVKRIFGVPIFLFYAVM
jgi:hypothetical protein